MHKDIKNEIRVLNTIRAFASLIVLISHYSNVTKVFGGVLGKGGGQIGVMLFFVLSGFLMTYLYAKKDFTHKSIYKYFVARFARVVPLFIFMVITSYLLQFINTISLYDINSISLLITHLLFINGVSVLWTIPVEIQYYMLFVFLWLFIYKLSIKFYGFIVLFVLSLILSTLDAPLLHLLNHEITLNIIKALPYFLVGSAFGLIFTSSIKNNKYVSNYWGLSIFILLLVFPQIFHAIFNRELILWGNPLVLLSVSLFFYTVVFLTPSKSIIYANCLGDYFGKISYSLYLWHLPILYSMKAVAREHKFLIFPLYLLAVVIVASLSYYLLEDPLRKLLRHYFNKNSTAKKCTK